MTWRGIGLFFVSTTVIFLQFSPSSCDRSIPAKSDICARVPSLSWCGGNGGSAPVPPAVPSAGSEPAGKLDKDQYCSKFLPNFKYYCSGPGNGDARLGTFCPTYSSICGASLPQQQQPVVDTSAQGAAANALPQQPSPTQYCAQVQAAAQSSCTYPATESTQTRYYCDFYREYCLNLQSAPGVIVQPQPSDPRCGQYVLQFDMLCVRQPITVQSYQFCESYVTYCSGYRPSGLSQLGVVPAVPLAPMQPAVPLPAAAPAQQQTAPALPQTPSDASPQQVEQLCGRYKSMALQHCKGHEVGQIKKYCDMYRQNCISRARRRRFAYLH